MVAVIWLAEVSHKLLRTAMGYIFPTQHKKESKTSFCWNDYYRQYNISQVPERENKIRYRVWLALKPGNMKTASIKGIIHPEM